MKVHIEDEATGLLNVTPEAALEAMRQGKPGRMGRAVFTGKFGESGVVVFPEDREFECAIHKADCEVVIAGRLQRFVAESTGEEPPEKKAEREKAYELLAGPSFADGLALLAKLGEAPRLFHPQLGWTPLLCASTDVLQLQGAPNETWRVELAFVEHTGAEVQRKARYEERGEGRFYKERKTFPCPSADAVVEVPCEAWMCLQNDLRK